MVKRRRVALKEENELNTRVSDYERLRLENIKENNRRLLDLGLGGSGNTNQLKIVSGSKEPQKVKARRQPTVGSRRSRRLEQLEAVDYVDNYVDNLPSFDTDSGQVAKRAKPTVVRRVLDYNEQTLAEDGIHVKFASGSCEKGTKQVNANMEPEWIGKIILPPANSNSMKLSVMSAITSTTPKFSKYSGIQEFLNCIVLFVNIGSDNYDNVFKIEDDSIHINWFAQSRQHEETPVIQRILNREKVVYLFCRLTGKAYVCCGEMTMTNSDTDVRPMHFEFHLTESKRLLESSAFNDLLL